VHTSVTARCHAHCCSCHAHGKGSERQHRLAPSHSPADRLLQQGKVLKPHPYATATDQHLRRFGDSMKLMAGDCPPPFSRTCLAMCTPMRRYTQGWHGCSACSAQQHAMSALGPPAGRCLPGQAARHTTVCVLGQVRRATPADPKVCSHWAQPPRVTKVKPHLGTEPWGRVIGSQGFNAAALVSGRPPAQLPPREGGGPVVQQASHGAEVAHHVVHGHCR